MSKKSDEKAKISDDDIPTLVTFITSFLFSGIQETDVA